jgi:hypothetical protein
MERSASGRVVVTESGRGIPGLVVEIFDVPAGDEGLAPESHRRLASGSTGSTGDFVLGYGSSRDEQDGVNLLLTVSGPEEPEKEPNAIFTSLRVRYGAAAQEYFLVRIPVDKLLGAALAVGTPEEKPAELTETVARQLESQAQRDVGVAAAERAALAVKVRETEVRAVCFHSDFAAAIERRLSKVSDAQAASETFVSAGDPIDTAVTTVLSDDVANVINNAENRAPVKVRFALTDVQRDAVEAALAPDGTISGDEVDDILESTMRGIEYVAERPLASIGRDLSDRERRAATAIGIQLPIPAEDDEGDEHVDETDDDVVGDGVDFDEAAAIPRYVARLMDSMTSPEESLLTGLEPQATREGVGDEVKRFQLKPSPADVSAFYDFSHLQIAFRHVWQEAIDEGVLTLAENAYDEIVKSGATPKVDAHRDPLRALTRAGEIVVRAGARPGTIAKAIGEVSATGKGRESWMPGIPDGVFQGMGTRPERDPGESDPLVDIISELNQRLREPYSFTTFAASGKERSINFGCLVTYRQEWCPKVYQAGRLVKTVTLAPMEVQKYTKTVRRRTKRAEKEVKNHLQIRKDDSTETSRLEQDIIAKALTKTNFSMSAEETAPGGAGPSSKTSFERGAEKTSESVKKAFHEAVFKAAQETKDEHNLEIATEDAEEYELVETGELNNPNKAVAVAFLFYELQRRYRVTERIHRVTPVVFVAQEMPAPHEINESWLISHDWILRRVLLDDSFVAALDYLCTRIVGDQVAIAEIRTNITQQRQLLAEMKQQLRVVRERVATYRSMLEKQLLATAKVRSSSGGGALSGLLRSIPGISQAIELSDDAVEAVGEFINPDTPDVGDSRLDALKETIQRSVDEERDAVMRVEREVTALNALTETYARMLADNQNQRAQVLRLRTHIKQNITYYMQAIWNHEPPDQRYLRLHETPVPVFDDQRRYHFADLVPDPEAMTPFAHRPGGEATKIYEADVVASFTLDGTQPLAKVANLDNLIGYFGNLMMFALKDANPLTDFMMEPYVVRGFDELTDPDDVGNWTLDEFADYVIALEERLTTQAFAKVKDRLMAQYERLISAPLRNGEEIVVPTNSVFIEALPAGTSLDEGLRRLEREMEVKAAQENVRAAAMRNLRLADRLLHGERDDPEIDKRIVVSGVPVTPGLPLDDPS